MKYTILLLFCIILSILDLCSPSVLLTSAPFGIVSLTNTAIGTVITVSVAGFYVLSLIVLIYALAVASKEAKVSAFDELRNDQEGRSVRSADDGYSFLGSYLNSALNIDTGHCLGKFLCELETNSFWEKQREEKFLLDIFGDFFINYMLEEGKYKNDLKKAKLVGRGTRSLKLCKDSYNECEFSLQDLSTAWKATLSLRRMFGF